MNSPRSTSDCTPEDDELSTREIEKLMMPDIYQPRKHRSRSMPQRKPRLRLAYTSESEKK